MHVWYDSAGNTFTNSSLHIMSKYISWTFAHYHIQMTYDLFMNNQKTRKHRSEFFHHLSTVCHISGDDVKINRSCIYITVIKRIRIAGIEIDKEIMNSWPYECETVAFMFTHNGFITRRDFWLYDIFIIYGHDFVILTAGNHCGLTRFQYNTGVYHVHSSAYQFGKAWLLGQFRFSQT